MIASFKNFSQSFNVPVQYYLDKNTNCIYDAGDTLIYNHYNFSTLNYVSASTATTNVNQLSFCNYSFTVINPQLPPNNHLTISTNTNSPVIYNSGCPAYTNLSYTSVNYLPVNSVKQQVYEDFEGYGFASNVPVCFNIGNDSCHISLNFLNLYTCGSIVTTRTYSVYLDGNLIDNITITGGAGANSVSSVKASIYENVSTNYSWINFNTLLPAGISALGQHTLELKSSPLYNHPNAKVYFKRILTSYPCTKINGKFYNDCNSNCIYDAGDSKINFGVKGTIANPTSTISFYPDYNGNYSVYTSATSSFAITTNSTIASFTPCASATATTNIPAGITTSTLNFGYKSNIYYDPYIFQTFSPNTLFPSNNAIIYTGFATNITSVCTPTTAVNPGKLKLFLDKKFIYLSPFGTTPAPSNIVSTGNGDTLIWNIANFPTIGATQYTINVQVSSSVTIGTTYTLYATTNALYDYDLLNNSFVGMGVIGYPMDPNGKTCYAQGIQPNGDIPLGTQDLFYTINFQNVGTAPAINVITADTLDPNLDWSSLKVLGSSFPVQTQVDNNTGLTFFSFHNIYLPDSTSNPSGSHGWVYYKIKLKPGVPVNTIIKNRAHNYFDSNPPVPTNQTKNKLVLPAGINELVQEKDVLLYPNPTTGKISINSEMEIKQVILYNSVGEILVNQAIEGKVGVVDISKLPEAIYLMKIELKNNQTLVKKVIKN